MVKDPHSGQEFKNRTRLFAHRGQSTDCTVRNTQSAWIEPPMK